MDTLIREGNPPAGQLASPVPQVWDPTANGGAGGWVRVYGAHNSPRAILYGPNGQPISTTNRLPVEATLSGSSVPYTAPLYINRPVRSQVQTLLNAVSVPAGGNTEWVNVSPGGERYIILLFNCDQPWRAWTNAPWAQVPYGFLYPSRSADQNPSPLANFPAISVVLAPLDFALLDSSAASMAEVLAAALPWSGLRVQISNRGAATATITLRVLRLFV